MIITNESEGIVIMPGFTEVCVIKADLSNMAGTLEECIGPRGIYWRANFEVGILFGGTELAAKLFWKASNVRVITPTLCGVGLIFLTGP
jgi:hypothetical protein